MHGVAVVGTAHTRYANSLLKYHHFIDSMPEDATRCISQEHPSSLCLHVIKLKKVVGGCLFQRNAPHRTLSRAVPTQGSRQLPFSVPEILEFKVFRCQRHFPGFSLGIRQDPANSRSPFKFLRLAPAILQSLS